MRLVDYPDTTTTDRTRPLPLPIPPAVQAEHENAVTRLARCIAKETGRELEACRKAAVAAYLALLEA